MSLRHASIFTSMLLAQANSIKNLGCVLSGRNVLNSPGATPLGRSKPLYTPGVTRDFGRNGEIEKASRAVPGRHVLGQMLTKSKMTAAGDKTGRS